MGLLDWLASRFRRTGPQPQGSRTITPDMVVIGGYNRRSGYEVGELDRVVADGVQITPSIIRYLRYLALADEDVYGAVRDLVVLANPGFEFNIKAKGGRHEKRAREALASIDSLFETGSLHAFVNNQIVEVVVAGASAVEWVPNRGRTAIKQAYPVPAETIKLVRRRDGTLEFWQEVAGQEVRLNPATFLYAPLQTVGDSPYGIPLIIAALSALQRKGRMIENIDRLIEILGIAGIVHVSVQIPPPQEAGFESELDPAYIDMVTRKLRKVADLLTEGERQGVFVTPAGTEMKVTSPARDISGAFPAWQDNEHRIWSGVRTLPFMRGRSESLSETWAKVAFPIILAEAKNIQAVVKRQLEFGLNLHLRLQGIAATVEIEFKEPQSPFTESNARARRTDIEADKMLLDIFGADPDLMKRLREKHGLPPEPVEDQDGVSGKAVEQGPR